MSEQKVWSWRHAIIKSSLPPTTRHVLLTLSCFMNDVGGGCYPSQETLAEATGLSDRAVRTHLEVAETAGWIRRSEHGFRGQKWRSTEYEALWPDILHVEEGAERRAGPSSEGAEAGSGKVRNDVPTILPMNNTPLSPKTGQGSDPALDVDGRAVHSIREEDLYRACCKLTKRSPGITSRDGTWFFKREVIDEARTLLGGVKNG